MSPMGCSSACSCGSVTGISCVISRSHYGNRTGISCISSSQQRGSISVFFVSFLVAVVVTELVFLALTVVNWSLNARTFLRLTKQTMEIRSTISTTAPTLTPIAIFLVFPVGSKITDDKNSWNHSERVQPGGGATVKLKGSLNSVTDRCNHKMT